MTRLQEAVENFLTFLIHTPDSTQESCTRSLEPFQNAHPIVVEADDQLVPGTILISSPLTPLPREGRDKILLKLLKINVEIEETLSVKPDVEMIFLHHRISSDANIEQAFENFQRAHKRIRLDLESSPS